MAEDVVARPVTESSWDRLARAILEARPGLAERLPTDPQAYLELISLVSAARSETAVLLSTAVASARRAGCTWNQIGDVLGVTRQAAQQQYGSDADSGIASPTPTESMMLTPLTAFNEMEVLDRAGKYGWYSVGYGPLYHRVERDIRQWQHARTFLGAVPDGEGWQRIGWGWVWWIYWRRPLALPALSGNPSAADLVEDRQLW